MIHKMVWLVLNNFELVLSNFGLELSNFELELSNFELELSNFELELNILEIHSWSYFDKEPVRRLENSSLKDLLGIGPEEPIPVGSKIAQILLIHMKRLFHKKLQLLCMIDHILSSNREKFELN